MSWSPQGRNMPSNWQAITRTVKTRDGHRCTWIRADDTRCTETTRLEVDHIGDPDDHSLTNLRTLCHWHHARRTAAQSAAARAAQHRAGRTTHPGLT